jgi:hypothetical protein
VNPRILFFVSDCEVYFFLIKGKCFVNDNRGISVNGGVFIFVWPLEYLITELPIPTKRTTVSLIKVELRNALLHKVLVLLSI